MSHRMRVLMVVSARADADLRREVAHSVRPEPEYLRLERDHDFDLLDWSGLAAGHAHRSPSLTLRHARAARDRVAGYDCVLSDGEQVGLALAVSLGSRRPYVRHTMIAHHLTPAKKRVAFGFARSALQDAQFIVHCEEQRRYAASRFHADNVHLVPYGIDLDFWRPQNSPEGGFIMSAGQEHRDYATLAAACAATNLNVFVAAGSLHSAHAHVRLPKTWPAGFRTEFAPPHALREHYAACDFFVMPLMPTDFQAGVTALLEAMAMGKAVIATATPAMRELVIDGETGLLVPPEDPRALLLAITRLRSDPRARRRMGQNARQAVERRHGLDEYAGALAAVTRGLASVIAEKRAV